MNSLLVHVQLSNHIEKNFLKHIGKKYLEIRVDQKNLASQDLGILTVLSPDYSGQVKLLMDPALHAAQYPNYFPIADPADLEKVQAREVLRR